MRRFTMLLCLYSEIENELALDHGFWGFAADLYFEDVADVVEVADRHNLTAEVIF